MEQQIRSRPYEDSDLPSLQDALARWTQAAGNCGYSHTGYIPHMIYSVLRDRRPSGELVQIWDTAEGIAGIAINGLFDTSFLLFVSPSLRGGAAERSMLEAAYTTTRRHLSAVQGPDAA